MTRKARAVELVASLQIGLSQLMETADAAQATLEGVTEVRETRAELEALRAKHRELEAAYRINLEHLEERTRERDEARAQVWNSLDGCLMSVTVDRLRAGHRADLDALRDMQAMLDEARAALEATKAERDQHREELSVLGSQNRDFWEGKVEAERVRDSLYAQLAAVTRERDDLKAMHAALDFKRERDELRDALNRRFNMAYRLDTMQAPEIMRQGFTFESWPGPKGVVE